MYSYVGNDPVNRTDPSGLFWGKLFGFVNKVVKWLKVALAVAIIVLTVWLAPALAGVAIAKMLTMAGLLLGSALGPRWLQTAIAVGMAAVGIYLQGPQIIWNLAQAGAGAADRALSVIAWLNVVGTVTRFLASTPQQSQWPKNFAKISAQANFDFCAQQAMRRYRKIYLKTSGKAILGGAGIGLGLSVGIGIRGVGLGIRGAAHAAQDLSLGPLGRALTSYMELKDSGIIATGFSIIGGGMAINSIREANLNSAATAAAIEQCKRWYPNADHSFSSLNF
jgi:hypothetical protein